jgi:phosphopantothenate-cysteine ligase
VQQRPGNVAHDGRILTTHSQVRSIDNFSTGSRGSISGEKFLEAGYAVIFLHRAAGRCPYSRRFHGKSVLDLVRIEEDGRCGLDPNLEIENAFKLRQQALRGRQSTPAGGQGPADSGPPMLLELPFTTVTEYLFYLRGLTKTIAPLGPRACV